MPRAQQPPSQNDLWATAANNKRHGGWKLSFNIPNYLVCENEITWLKGDKERERER